MANLERRVIKIEKARGADAWLRTMSDDDLVSRIAKLTGLVIGHPDTPEDIRDSMRGRTGCDTSNMTRAEVGEFSEYLAWLQIRTAEEIERAPCH